MYNILVDPLPLSVKIGGKDYKIKSNFRGMILFSMVLEDARLSGAEKVETGLNLFYESVPANIEEAAAELFRFYSGSHQENGCNRGKEQTFSFLCDSQYVYAAFMETYGIDLISVDYMHWWSFMALFNSLPEHCRLSKIMGLRAHKIDGKMNEEEKAFYRDMKEIYAIPKYLSAEEVVEISEYQRKSDEFEALFEGE